MCSGKVTRKVKAMQGHKLNIAIISIDHLHNTLIAGNALSGGRVKKYDSRYRQVTQRDLGLKGTWRMFDV